MEAFGPLWLAIIVVGVVLMGGIVLGGRGRGAARPPRRPSTDGSADDAAMLSGTTASAMVPGVGDAPADPGAAGDGGGTASGGGWGGDTGGGSGSGGDGSGGSAAGS
jgi:hypothetical protein